MMCAVTIRSIKPGTFEEFREAWEPRPWPDKLQRVIVSRNEQDPDQVLTASFIDVSWAELEDLREDPDALGAEEARLERIAEYQDAVVFKGIFDVAEDITAPA